MFNVQKMLFEGSEGNASKKVSGFETKRKKNFFTWKFGDMSSLLLHFMYSCYSSFKQQFFVLYFRVFFFFRWVFISWVSLKSLFTTCIDWLLKPFTHVCRLKGESGKKFNSINLYA